MAIDIDRKEDASVADQYLDQQLSLTYTRVCFVDEEDVKRFEKKRGLPTADERLNKNVIPLQKDYKAFKGSFKHFVYLLEEEMPPQ